MLREGEGRLEGREVYIQYGMPGCIILLLPPLYVTSSC